MNEELESIDQLTDAQVQDLHRLFQQEWWSRGRHIADIRVMLAGPSLVFGFCEPASGKLVAFARVLTDDIYKALIFDVIVDEGRRGEGLGRALIDSILNHPRLRRVRHFELYCAPERVGFYEQWGFTSNLGKLKFMRLERIVSESGSDENFVRDLGSPEL